MKTTTKIMAALFISSFATGTTFAQVKIGANPTAIESTSNLEVEASTTGRKVKVDKTSGQVTIADGTQGAGKILTSNAAGASSWQLPAVQNADVMLSVGISNQSVTSGVQKLNLTTVAFDKGSNFNLATDEFTAPTAGYYQLNLLVVCGVVMPTGTGRFAQLFINGVSTRTLFNQHVNADDGYTVYSGALIKLNAGDIVAVTVGTAGGSPQPYTITSGFLDINKISN